MATGISILSSDKLRDIREKPYSDIKLIDLLKDYSPSFSIAIKLYRTYYEEGMSLGGKIYMLPFIQSLVLKELSSYSSDQSRWIQSQLISGFVISINDNIIPATADKSLEYDFQAEELEQILTKMCLAEGSQITPDGLKRELVNLLIRIAINQSPSE